MSMSERDSDSWITVNTNRGVIRARAVIHTTNRWASHLLPEFEKLILPMKSTVAAIKAPAGFIKHTGAQQWDSQVNVSLSYQFDVILWAYKFAQNYHIQLPPPYNVIILGGARAVLVHNPDECYNRDNDDLQFEGVPEFMRSWPESDVADWDGNRPTELARDANDGGCWTGSESNLSDTRTAAPALSTDRILVTASSVDMFPFVGPVPKREGHWMAAGFVGHGELLSLHSLMLKTNAYRNATHTSLNSPHHSGSSCVARLRVQAACTGRSIPAIAKTFPRYGRESGKTARCRSCRQS